MKIFAYDKSQDRVIDNWDEGSLVDRAYNFIVFGHGDDLTSFEKRSVEERFVFFNEKTAAKTLTKHAKFRNPIIDNIAFQKRYEFDKENFTKQKLEFRMSLLKEEYEETMSAYLDSDSEEWVDGHIDLIVIALGNLHLAGIDISKAWNEVYQANMSKVRGVKPGRESSGGFDVIKPEGWKGPNHEDNHGTLDEIFAEN
jgi:NTP pyrophosphatase (non-canonical NTP hydrolase)